MDYEGPAGSYFRNAFAYHELDTAGFEEVFTRLDELDPLVQEEDASATAEAITLVALIDDFYASVYEAR